MKESFARRTWTLFSALTLVIALICLALMYNHPRREFFYAAVIVGTIAFVWDLVIEYFGVSKRLWRYSEVRFTVGGVPLAMPAIFFSCAVIVAFWFYAFETNPMSADFLEPVIWKLSLVQLGLIGIGIYFMAQYFKKKVYTTVFWLLPFGIALYLAYPEPWILVIAIIPMYLDYVIEKTLVKNKKIDYTGYDSELAINIAISYFPAALVLLGLIALLVEVFS